MSLDAIYSRIIKVCLAEAFLTLHGCSDWVRAHHCSYHAMEIARMQMSCIEKTKNRYLSSIKQNGIVTCTFRSHFVNLNRYTV